MRSRAAKGFGPRRIQGELRERGLDDGFAEAAFQSADVDWYALANAARTKKFGHNVPPEMPERFRQMRYLEYRGFTHDHIQTALERSEQDDD